jgi:enoyl-CoA hydratase
VFTLTRIRSVAVLTMQHGKANALDIEFCNGLAEQFDKLRQTDAQAVVMTGQGRIFSAGVDLLRATSSGPDYFKSFLPALSRLYTSAFFFSTPLVAAVNGHAVAGGCILAACADWRLIAQGEARIGVTELLVGVAFPPLAFEIMRFASAHKYFPEIIYTAATYPGDEAVKRGLVDEIVTPEKLLDVAIEKAELLAALRPDAFAHTKRQMRQPVADALEHHGTKVEQDAADIWLAPATAKSMADYVSRTFKKS